MYCSKCGTKLADNARFCTECGTQVEAEQEKQTFHSYAVAQPPKAKKKKGCFARLISGIFGAFAALVLLVILIPTDSDKPASSTQKVASTKPTATVSVTATPEVEPQTTVSKETVEGLKVILKAAASDVYSFFDVTGDETGFTLTIASAGLTQAVALAQADTTGSLLPAWEESKTSLMNLYEQTYALIEQAGMKEPALMINVVNDLNHDYTLLAIIDHQIVYDVLAE